MFVTNLKHSFLSGSIAIGLAFLVTGCETKPTGKAMAAPEPTVLMVGLTNDSNAGKRAKAPRDVSKVITSKAELEAAVAALSPNASVPPGKLKQLIRRIENENNKAANGLRSFRSLGGGYTQALMAGAKGKIGANDDYDPNKNVTVELSGQITGYTYNQGNGSGVVALGGAFEDPLSECNLTLEASHTGSADKLTGFRLVRELGRSG